MTFAHRYVFRLFFAAFLPAFMFSQPIYADENDIQQITESNMAELTSQVADDYYNQLESLVTFYKLYQQKRDPRGFNVWHLRGFTPNYSAQSSYYQTLLASAPAEIENAKAAIDAFNAVGTIASQLMIAFRDNNADAYANAVSLVETNNEVIASLLAEYGNEDAARQISLN